MEAIVKWIIEQPFLPPEILSFALSVTCGMTIYGTFLHFEYGPQLRIKKDPFNKIVLQIGNTPFSFWPVTHFLFYTCLGFISPGHFQTIMVLGIIWESIEMLLNYMFAKPSTGSTTEKKEQYSEYWWAANWTDILFNGAGYWFGTILRKAVIGNKHYDIADVQAENASFVLEHLCKQNNNKSSNNKASSDEQET